MDNIDLTLYKGSGYATIFTIKDSNSIPLDLSGYDITITFFDDMGIEVVNYKVQSDELSLTSNSGEIELILSKSEVDTINEGTYTLVIDDGIVSVTVTIGNILVVREFTSNIEYLIPYLRLKIGDINPSTYRYANEWLLTSLILSVKTLQRYWDSKYIVSTTNVITRNGNYRRFTFDSPPVIETADEYIIILMAAIIVLEGSLENSAWDVSSWSDAEIRYTNIDSGKLLDTNLKRFTDELSSLILPPTKRLAKTNKMSLPGYTLNNWEQKTLL
jgi:hypothetical protein